MSFRSLTLAVLALLIAACDRETAPHAQQQEQLGQDKRELSGEVDRSRAGEPIPAVELVDPSGAKLELASLKGQPVLVNLWATWCIPCITEMPLLDELAADYGDSLQVVTVSQDLQGADRVVPFFAKNDFENLPQWLDTETDLSFAYGDGVLPTTVLYESSGTEVWRIVGDYDWSSAQARGLIDEALASAE